ncbi:Cytosolic phospholipase A2 [Portunus trituberculatus]|uniref:Phospholipase A2 n=1 Tax=Portunus trituberculatus TaxID=210409 RepID=A0A5B7FLD6_PORTR|nr:Cytosolic phospholipase A2 [Portunus trituberculatus]
MVLLLSLQVQHEACDDLQITIKRGESITKGSTFQDLMDTPDPYVVLRIPGSSNSCKRTSHVDNCTNPIWDESFHFFLDPSKEYTLHVILMDANYTMDETLGEQTFTLDLLTLDTPRDVIFDFPNGSKVHTVLTLQKNKNPDLRFSLALCKEEKNFLQIRRRKVLAAMKKLLGHKAPENEKQVSAVQVSSVWGSAFTILIKRLVMEGGKKDIVQIMRDAQNEENMENGNVKDTHSSAESSDSEDEEYIEGHDDKESEEEEVEEHKSSPAQPLAENGLQYSIPEEDQQTQPKRKTSEITKGRSLDQMDVDNKKMTSSKSFDSLSSEKEGKVNGRDKGDIRPKMKKTSAFSFDLQNKKASKDIRKFSTESDPGVSTEYQKAQHPRLQRQGAMKGSRMNKEEASRPTSPSQDKWATRSIMTGTNILNSRAGRAGEVLNPFRGLSLRHSFPISPFATDVMGNDEDQEDAVDSDTGFGASCRYKPLDNKAKKLFIVDSGLAFNSPYPLLLRPQRAVDIYLSFDFSQRPTDSSQPFKELLLAEKWATQNKVPFPPIQNQVAQYEGQEVRECYVFKHPTDPFCPVILHFPLVNNKFREFSAPGVPRETEEEKKFGDFPIFDDPSNAFSSMNFAYEAIQFDRLTKLIEFNTLLCVDTIKKELEEVVEKKKQYIPKLTFKDVVNTMKRMSSFSPGDRGNNDLTLKVSLENEEELKRRTRYASVPNEDSSDDSEDDYIDALDKIPDETTTL